MIVALPQPRCVIVLSLRSCPGPVSEPADQADRALCGGRPAGHRRRASSAPALQEKIGQSVVVENRPGGAGSVAVTAINAAPADGYTLMVTDGSTVTANPALFKSLSYTAKDVPGVALLGRAPLFLVAHSDVPVNSLKEFIDYVKANPGKVNYGSSGVGSAHHLSMEAMKAALGLNMTHVPYRGTGQSVPALLGGHVQVIFSAYPSLAAAIADKRVKLLATNGAQPSPQAPDVPPIASVIPGFDLATMVGIFARAGTPPRSSTRSPPRRPPW